MKKLSLKDFPSPKTNCEEILLHLIIYGTVSCNDFFWLSGFRTRVSNLILQHGLFLTRTMEKSVNKFGNTYTYAIHGLPENQLEKAIQLYQSLNKK